jgi:hypothetical protein
VLYREKFNALGGGKLKEIKLSHGSVRTYNFDTIKLHAYETKNPLTE